MGAARIFRSAARPRHSVLKQVMLRNGSRVISVLVGVLLLAPGATGGCSTDDPAPNHDPAADADGSVTPGSSSSSSGAAGNEGGAPGSDAGGGDAGAGTRACPSTPSGATLHVRVDATDEGDGTEARPFRTVAAALARAEPGDRVLLGAGVHRERVVFPKSGTESAPIILEGEAGAIVDGGDRITGWELAPEIGPHVYKNATFTYAPHNMTWNDKYVLRMGELVDRDEGFTILNEGPEGWDTYQGAPYRSWDGVEAMFGTFDDVAYLRFGNDANPNDQDLTFAPEKRGALETVGKSWITICNLTARGAYDIVKVDEASSHIVVSGNTLRGGYRGVEVSRGSHDNLVIGNEVTLDYVHSLDPSDPRHWFIWSAFKRWSDYDRIAVNLYEAGSDNTVAENHLFQHWGGVQDSTASTATNVEQYAQNLKVFGNHIEHIADDGLEPNGGEVNAEWHDNLVHHCNIALRVKPPAIGPMYIYRNRLSAPLQQSDESENLGIYFHIGVTGRIFVYHNSVSTYQAWAMGNQRDVGAPNAWYVNNAFSSPHFGNGQGDANFPHFDHDWVGGDASRAAWMGAHVVLAPGGSLWATGDTALPVAADSPLRGAGLDLSKPWTLDGETHPALPGMTAGYFVGGAPTLGAVQ